MYLPLLPGMPQHLWGAKDVDVEAEAVAALLLTEPPLSASLADMEAALEASRGDVQLAEEVLSYFRFPHEQPAACKLTCCRCNVLHHDCRT